MSLSGASKFGRVPAQTVDLIERNVSMIRDNVLPGLPSSAGGNVRADTLEAILDVVLRDWRENDNTAGLLDSDSADLKAMVQAAASLAGQDINGQDRPVYLAILRGLLSDWLANWNAPDDPGPPGPVD